MTELVQKALCRFSELPEADQEAVAARLLEQIEEIADERLWDEKFAKSQVLLAKMADAALEEHCRGETRPLEELLDEH